MASLLDCLWLRMSSYRRRLSRLPPCRLQQEKLRFPSGTATAKVIRMLHGGPPLTTETENDAGDGPLLPIVEEDVQRTLDAKASLTASSLWDIDRSTYRGSSLDAEESQPLMLQRLSSRSMPVLCLSGAASLARADSSFGQHALEQLSTQGMDDKEEWSRAWATLLWTFAAAAVYTLASSQVAWLKSFPVFTWLGFSAATRWGWELTPSMGYIGQGMIMGPKTAFSMLGGAVLGYGVLGPYAAAQGWAPGEVGDWKTGPTGWILWVSLAIMLGDSLTSLSLLIITSFGHGRKRGEEDEVEQPGCKPIPASWWLGGLVVSTVLCTTIMTPMLHLRLYEPLAAVAIALLVAVLAVRALGQTDLNPVSGVGKLSQVVFAVIAPRQVLPNLVAGAIAEAGANQAGDMMQDFKTAQLLGVCPRAQFVAMLLGSAVSAAVSVGAYSLYTSAWQIPGPDFPAPTAEIWLDMADLVNGGKLPPHVVPFCIVAAMAAAILPIAALLLMRASTGLKEDVNLHQVRCWRARMVRVANVLLPSGIGVAVGLYVSPKWTIPRVVGSLAEQIWLRCHKENHKRLMVIVASGFVLGEGTASIVTAVLRAIAG